MSYRFHKEQTCLQNVRRIASEQLGKALAHLDDWSDVHEIVHDLRKRFKKLRGLLRLVRGSIDDYKRRNVHFRDAARTLSDLRDAQALVETIDLLDPDRDEISQVALDEACDALQKWRDTSATSIDSIRESLDPYREQLADDLEAVRHWKLDARGFDALSDGLAKTYKRARKALGRSREDAAVENVHELRKRAKYHWYHMRLLQDLWPRVIKARRGECKRLQKALGDIHDLDVLGESLTASPDLEIDPELRDRILRASSLCRQRLWRFCDALAGRVFAEDSKAGVRAYRSLFQTWRHRALQPG